MVNAKCALVAAVVFIAALSQSSAVPGDTTLQEYAGVYRWSPDAYVYLQLWDEFTGFGKPRQLVAFDGSGDVWNRQSGQVMLCAAIAPSRLLSMRPCWWSELALAM